MCVGTTWKVEEGVTITKRHKTIPVSLGTQKIINKQNVTRLAFCRGIPNNVNPYVGTVNLTRLWGFTFFICVSKI